MAARRAMTNGWARPQVHMHSKPLVCTTSTQNSKTGPRAARKNRMSPRLAIQLRETASSLLSCLAPVPDDHPQGVSAGDRGESIGLGVADGGRPMTLDNASGGIDERSEISAARRYPRCVWVLRGRRQEAQPPP